ncbi:hypothetical protein ACJX0J_035497, partial [Zea mays]
MDIVPLPLAAILRTSLGAIKPKKILTRSRPIVIQVEIWLGLVLKVKTVAHPKTRHTFIRLHAKYIGIAVWSLITLNIVGFSGALANPLIAPEHDYSKNRHTANNSAHGTFMHLSYGRYFNDATIYSKCAIYYTKFGNNAMGAPMEKPKAYSDMTDVALAFEVPGGWFQERDAAIMTVIQTLMGGGGSFSTGGPGKGMHSRLSLRVLNKYHFVESLSAFSNVYDNTGLFGIYLTTSPYHVAKAVDIAISELIAVATPGEVTEVELRRAKNSTISSVLMNLESRVVVAEDIGRQMLSYGSRKPMDNFLQRMEGITLDDVATFARKMLASRPTMVSWGD